MFLFFLHICSETTKWFMEISGEGNFSARFCAYLNSRTRKAEQLARRLGENIPPTCVSACMRDVLIITNAHACKHVAWRALMSSRNFQRSELTWREYLARNGWIRDPAGRLILRDRKLLSGILVRQQMVRRAYRSSHRSCLTFRSARSA